jgi:hypothetical protein
VKAANREGCNCQGFSWGWIRATDAGTSDPRIDAAAVVPTSIDARKEKTSALRFAHYLLLRISGWTSKSQHVMLYGNDSTSAESGNIH